MSRREVAFILVFLVIVGISVFDIGKQFVVFGILFLFPCINPIQHHLVGDARIAQQTGHEALFLEQGQEQMLGAYTVAVHLGALGNARTQHLLRALANGDLLRNIVGIHYISDFLFNKLLQGIGIDMERFQQMIGTTTAFADNSQHQMLGSDIAVLQSSGLFAAVFNHIPQSF